MSHKATLSISGPTESIHKFLEKDKEARIKFISTNNELDNTSVLVHLSIPISEIKRLLTLYKLDGKFLALDKYPTSCPLVLAALEAYTERITSSGKKD